MTPNQDDIAILQRVFINVAGPEHRALQERYPLVFRLPQRGRHKGHPILIPSVRGEGLQILGRLGEPPYLDGRGRDRSTL